MTGPLISDVCAVELVNNKCLKALCLGSRVPIGKDQHATRKVSDLQRCIMCKWPHLEEARSL